MRLYQNLLLSCPSIILLLQMLIITVELKAQQIIERRHLIDVQLEEQSSQMMIFELSCNFWHTSQELIEYISQVNKQSYHIVHCHSGGISEFQSSSTLSISSVISPLTNSLSLYSLPAVRNVPRPCFSSHWYCPSQTDPSFHSNRPTPCLRPLESCPSQTLPLLQITLAQLSAPMWKLQCQYHVLDSASKKTLPFPSSGCSSTCLAAHSFRYWSGNRELNYSVRATAGEEKSTPPPWYLLCRSVPLYSLPLAYLMVPKISCPSNTPTSVDASVYRTPSPRRRPASNSPSKTSLRKISRPWKCLRPDRNWPMYLEVLERRTPLPWSRPSFHSPTYLMPCMSFCSTVSRFKYSRRYSAGISRNSQSSRASRWQKDSSSSSSRSPSVASPSSSTSACGSRGRGRERSSGRSLRKTVECSSSWSTAGGSGSGTGSWLRAREWWRCVMTVFSMRWRSDTSEAYSLTFSNWS